MDHKIIFEFIKSLVFSRCGDGDCVIVVDNFSKMAYEFYEYENSLPNAVYIWGKQGEDWITFSPADEWQESIVFTSNTKIIEDRKLHDAIIYLNSYI
jgi:hypothetical protein